MPAPASATYSATAKIAANTSLLDEIDGGTGAGKVKIYTSADALLCTHTLSEPCGTVNGTTGQLTITAPSSVNASASGTAAYATITDGDDVVMLSLPAQSGVAAVAGKIVLNNLSLVSGSPVDIVSIVIG